MRKPPPPRPRRDVTDDVEFLLGNGESIHEVAKRLGLTVGGVARSLYRYGRADLARPFSAEQARQRRRAVA